MKKIGSDLVHLRLYLSCNHVGCCDSFKNKHAKKHFKVTGHPIMKSFEPGENWKCVCRQVVSEIIGRSPDRIMVTGKRYFLTRRQGGQEGDED